MLADYNADRRELLSAAGQDYVKQVVQSGPDRFVVDLLLVEWRHHEQHLRALDTAPEALVGGKATMVMGLPRIGQAILVVIRGRVGGPESRGQ